jgi:hypothetical protein
VRLDVFFVASFDRTHAFSLAQTRHTLRTKKYGGRNECYLTTLVYNTILETVDRMAMFPQDLIKMNCQRNLFPPHAILNEIKLSFPLSYIFAIDRQLKFKRTNQKL